MRDNWRESESYLILAACVMGALMYLVLGDFRAALGLMQGYLLGLFFWWMQEEKHEAWHREWSRIFPEEREQLDKAA